jgi:hypothetical protein
MAVEQIPEFERPAVPVCPAVARLPDRPAVARWPGRPDCPTARLPDCPAVLISGSAGTLRSPGFLHPKDLLLANPRRFLVHLA